jgi:hypothetical protein
MQKAPTVLPMAAGLLPFLRHGNSPSRRLLLVALVALACNVALATLAWFLVGLIMR